VTNGIAIGIGICVVGALVVDYAMFSGAGSLFMARKGMEFIEWVAFWR
jgi:hypothetical protein